jgi:hypothetical protein
LLVGLLLDLLPAEYSKDERTEALIRCAIFLGTPAEELLV